MSDKKHIDRLFQEKLKDFEVAPSNAVWENISAELHAEEKDRKIIPLWLKLSGVAVAILLLFTVGNAVFNPSDENPNQNTIVDTDNDNSNTESTEKGLKEQQDNIIGIDNLEEQKVASQETTNETLTTEPVSNNSPANNLTTQKDKLTNTVAKNTDNSVKTENQLKNATIDDILNSTKKDAVAKNEDDNNKVNSNVAKEVENVALNKNAVDKALDKTKSSENAIAKTEVDETTKEENGVENTEEKGEIVKEEIKTSIEEALAENTQQDEQDEKKKRKKIEDRWKIAPSIAPVYFNTLGSGSSIHEQFNENSKTGDVNMSYGVRGSYALTEKLSVRAGVNKVTMGYSTNDVFVLNNVTATPTDDRFLLRNVALKEEAQATSFVSMEEFNFAQVPSVISDQIIGSIDQKIGFVEIPIELEYELSSQRLGLRVLGGFSALFLNENEVYSTLDGETTLIGSATNLNKTSFSANLGVGLDFKLSEKFKLNLEPTFKYQLNTFTNTSGDFKPYFIGIYSGFSFKF